MRDRFFREKTKKSLIDGAFQAKYCEIARGVGRFTSRKSIELKRSAVERTNWDAGNIVFGSLTHESPCIRGEGRIARVNI
jgi:hypothetical protein